MAACVTASVAAGNATAATAAAKSPGAPAHDFVMVRCGLRCRSIKPRIDSLLAGDLILHHPALMICLTSIASQHLEETIQEHRLKVLDEEWSQCGQEVINSCFWVSQSLSVKSFLEDLCPAR